MELRSHNSVCEKRDKLCIYCDLSFKHWEFSEHIYACSSRSKPCPYCQKFVILRDFEFHTETQHEDGLREGTKSFDGAEIRGCSFDFSRKNPFLRSLKRESRAFDMNEKKIEIAEKINKKLIAEDEDDSQMNINIDLTINEDRKILEINENPESKNIAIIQEEEQKVMNLDLIKNDNPNPMVKEEGPMGQMNGLKIELKNNEEERIFMFNVEQTSEEQQLKDLNRRETDALPNNLNSMNHDKNKNEGLNSQDMNFITPIKSRDGIFDEISNSSKRKEENKTDMIERAFSG